MTQNIYLRKQFFRRLLKNLPHLILAIGGVWGQTYFPPYGQWERQQPKDVGVNSRLLERAVKFAIEHENQAPRKLEDFIKSTLTQEPHGDIIGPTKERGEMTGLIVKDGYIITEWGDIDRVDMTFSVTKTYLSTTVGLAYDRGMIRDVKDRVQEYLPTDHFTGEHNSKITWDHLLRQTSDWRGTLWDKPDWADRPPRDASWDEMQNQPLNEPGSHYKYNDVRVNLLALAALHVWRRPLPQILREYVMDPISASNTWRWHGYENSWVLMDGQMMQSVSGGGHWGGGMWINALDHARFGYLFLREGEWDGRRIISEKWIEMARTPGPANPRYGYMNWFLNTPVERDGKTTLAVPAAPKSTVTFRGAGSNIIYIDWDNDLLVVVRWIDRKHFNEFIEKVLASIKD